MPEYRFDTNRKRVDKCPCGKDNKDRKFVPYIGFENKGYCHSCGETFLPDLPDSASNHSTQIRPDIKHRIPPKRKIDFIPVDLFATLLNNGKHLNRENHFMQWLSNVKRGEFAFNNVIVGQLIQSYFLGNSNKYKGWVLFPYIDINGRIRDIKAIDYNPFTGKRISIKNGDAQDRCHFIGKEILNNSEANTERCFYGEHHLQGNSKPVRIFESEATATHAAPFFPESVCIATGGNNGCKWTVKAKCDVLQGRNVFLYPDIDGYDNWELKAEILKGYGIAVQVSQLIKSSALNYSRQNGIDYSELVKQKYDFRDILKYKQLDDFLKPIEPQQKQIQPLIEVGKIDNWEEQNEELENYFVEIAPKIEPYLIAYDEHKNSKK